MSRLEELCPDGVEYNRQQILRPESNSITCKKYLLSDLAKAFRGGYITKNSHPSGEIPVILGGQEPAYFIDTSNHSGEVVVIARSGASAGYVSYWNQPIFITDGFGYDANSNIILPKYLYYILKNRENELNQTKRGAGVPHVSGEKLSKLEFSIPPLEIQSEIVRILDAFSELKGELKGELNAELKARKKQYEYYCKKIICSAKTAKNIKIRELGQWSGGITPSMNNQEYWTNGTIPWISSKDMKSAFLVDTQEHISEVALKNTSIKLYPKDIVTVVVRSGILKHTFPVAFIPFETTINQDLKALIPNKNVLPKYAYYVLVTYAEDIRNKSKKQGGTVDSLDISKFMDYIVPLPDIDEQKEIIHILENFSSLSNSITSGLPAEIEAREKQYEYYRDLLLTFKPKVTA
ncbi:restriction endonuclease subunit S [Methanocorpusculum parvum]|uniref:Type I restriction modification DNA specificity domain-containing protein n=1 Tax=Methanocorpusculum parvum TaxID=2193 RepID=A0AAX0Q641_9EURY|nr:restriction endonuclease subunit S [Methanocorpusculum parvum]PAV08580.1 hypothetical protein ASJ83_03230 [Methanocorpusculum parvum]